MMTRVHGLIFVGVFDLWIVCACMIPPPSPSLHYLFDYRKGEGAREMVGRGGKEGSFVVDKAVLCVDGRDC